MYVCKSMYAFRCIAMTLYMPYSSPVVGLARLVAARIDLLLELDGAGLPLDPLPAEILGARAGVGGGAGVGQAGLLALGQPGLLRLDLGLEGPELLAEVGLGQDAEGALLGVEGGEAQGGEEQEGQGDEAGEDAAGLPGRGGR